MTTLDTTPTTATAATEADPAVLQALVERVGAIAASGFNIPLVALGDRLGLWKRLAACGPVTAGELAAAAGLAERYLREWLASQAAHGLVGYDPATGRFELGPEAALVLADEDSPALMIAAFQGAVGVARHLPALEQAFRTGRGIHWSQFDPTFFDVQERFSRPMLRQLLVDVWLAAVPGLRERLEAGITVADVGCGYGTSTLVMAEAFPHSTFVGLDFHDHSVAAARRAATERGLADRVRFEVADARAVPGDGYGLVLMVDALHDMGDPVAAARRAREVLAPDGVLVALDPIAGDSLAENLADPMAGLFYAVSTFLCTPAALGQPGPHALGAMAGERALRGVLGEAGFGSVERVAPDAPVNMVLVARP